MKKHFSYASENKMDFKTIVIIHLVISYPNNDICDFIKQTNDNPQKTIGKNTLLKELHVQLVRWQAQLEYIECLNIKI